MLYHLLSILLLTIQYKRQQHVFFFFPKPLSLLSPFPLHSSSFYSHLWTTYSVPIPMLGAGEYKGRSFF
jgi:hypothetical protein